MAIHRTAVFTLPLATQHVRKVLERAFRDYTHAYGALLHIAYLRYGRDDDLAQGSTAGLDALRGLATYAVDEQTGHPRMNARTLAQRLYRSDALPPRGREALERLPSRLRQSAREHAGQSLMSLVILADAWLHASAAQRGGPPSFPQRLRAADVRATRANVLSDLALLADNRKRERELFATLLTTREPQAVAIPFVGVSDEYGCGLYYSAQTDSFYARLDIIATQSKDAAPLAMQGLYTSVKTGARWCSEQERERRCARGESIEGIASFGRRSGSLWLPLKLEDPDDPDLPTWRPSYHERPLRFTNTSFLPVRRAVLAAGLAGSANAASLTPRPVAADPVAAKLVRRETRGKVWYQLHVTFELPEEGLLRVDGPTEGVTPEERRAYNDARPILAINRGLYHLYAAALLSADGRRELVSFAAGGRELLTRQAHMERVRQLRQQRAPGAPAVGSRNRRQSRVATHEIAVCANQIVEVAQRTGAQVVVEDLASFASGAAIRATRRPLKARQSAFRALLGRRQFEALHKLINARLELIGLPPACVVSAAFVSQTCTSCARRETRSFAERERAAQRAGELFDPRTFRCAHCGATRDIDALAAVNIGRKLVWLRQRRKEQAEGTAEGERTGWEAFATHLVGDAEPSS